MGDVIDALRFFPSAEERAENRSRGPAAYELYTKERRRAWSRAGAAKRKAAKLQRTPAWANTDAINAIYSEAARLTRTTGVQHHVDHIVPLQGKKVCGLHVENNLQVITAQENIRKHNRFDG